MNRLIASRHDLLDLSLNLRTEVLDAVDDADLAYRLPNCPSLSEVLGDIGAVEAAYTASFHTFVLHFDQIAPALDTVAAFKDWFAKLDHDLVATLSALSDEDLGRPLERGRTMPMEIVFYTFREAILVFATKASLYLRALGKPMPEQIAKWVG